MRPDPVVRSRSLPC